MSRDEVLIIGGEPGWHQSTIMDAVTGAHLTRAPTVPMTSESPLLIRALTAALPYPRGFFPRVLCHLPSAAARVGQAVRLIGNEGKLVVHTPGGFSDAERSRWNHILTGLGLSGISSPTTTEIAAEMNGGEVAEDNECVFCPRYRFALNRDSGVPGPASVLRGDDDFWCAPDLAPLAEGHLLLVTGAHHLCYGACPPRVDAALRRWKAEISRWYDRAYGARPTFFEHGPAESQSAGACIDHAHLHCVPGPLPLREALTARGLTAITATPSTLRRLHRRPVSYLYVEDARGASAYPCPPRLPNQFLRMAAMGGITPWRWQETYGVSTTRERFLTTLLRLLPEADRPPERESSQ